MVVPVARFSPVSPRRSVCVTEIPFRNAVSAGLRSDES